MLFKRLVLLEVSYFDRNIYKTETVTSGLCYIEDLRFLENNIVSFWNSLDVQWTTFCTSFWQKVHNSKKIINLQSLFALTIGYIDMTTYPLTKYCYNIKRDLFYFLFIGCLYFLSVHSHSCCFYIVSWRYERDYLHATIDILFYIMFYTINTMKKH